jgi:hypothetical protein
MFGVLREDHLPVSGHVEDAAIAADQLWLDSQLT